MRRLFKSLWLIKTIDEKKVKNLKQIYNHYLDKRKEIMKSTKFSVEDVFGKMNMSETINAEQLQKLNNFLSKMT